MDSSGNTRSRGLSACLRLRLCPFPCPFPLSLSSLSLSLSLFVPGSLALLCTPLPAAASLYRQLLYQQLLFGMRTLVRGQLLFGSRVPATVRFQLLFGTRTLVRLSGGSYCSVLVYLHLLQRS